MELRVLIRRMSTENQLWGEVTVTALPPKPMAGVEFIAENGGGPGVRLRKAQR
jgi:hypothetical protein